MIQQPDWNWSIRTQDQQIVVSHDQLPWRLEVEQGSDRISVTGDEASQRISKDDLRPEAHERESDTVVPWIVDLRETLQNQKKSEKECIRKGQWLFLEGREWFAFRHTDWPFYLTAFGASNGWLLSVGLDRIGYIYMADFEEYLRAGHWRPR